jgi:NitT/TauT family transport system substrate-binding protein
MALLLAGAALLLQVGGNGDKIYNSNMAGAREPESKGAKMTVQTAWFVTLGAALRRVGALVVAAALASPLPALAQAPTSLAVAKVAEDFALMMGDYGNKLGTFQRDGVAPEISLITQARMVQATVAGGVEMALASGATLAFAAKGAPLKAVAALSGPLTILVLVARPDNSVPTLDALRGRIAAVTNLGSLTDWAVSQIAVSKGWDVGDIKRVAVGDTPARIAALRTGNVDAAVVDLAAGLDLEERGEAKILVNFGDLIKSFQNQIIYASDKAIAEKPDAVRTFVKGWFQTIDYARHHKAETVAFAQQALNVRESVAAKVYDRLMPSNFFSTDGVIDPKTLQAMAKSFVELKLLPQEQDLSQFVTDRFLPGKN